MGTFNPIPDKSAFGEAKTAETTPVIQLQFPYNINSKIVKAKANQSGTVDINQNMARLQSGAAANSSAELFSVVNAKYNPGQGSVVRFTAVYGAQAGDNKQHVGIGNHSDGFFFSQTAAGFGISSRKGGGSEVRTLTVDTASDTDEDITVTLNGNSKTDVTITNQVNKSVMANEIAAHDFSDVGRGWDAFAVNETVIFVSWGPGARTGTYEIADVAGTAAVSFAQTVAGAGHTDAFVAQADWNIDPMLGTSAGDSGVTLDPTKGNVYQIQYQWLGFGTIVYSIEDPTTGHFNEVHRIEYPNANTSPSINNPTLPLYGASINTTNATNVILFVGSMMCGNEGPVRPTGYNHGISGSLTLGATSAETPIMSIRNKLVHQSTFNRVPIKILIINVGVEHSKTVNVNFYRNPTLVSASFTDIDASTSVVQKDTAATGFSGGTLLFTASLGKAGNTIISLDNVEAGLLQPGEIITATLAPTSGNTAEGVVSFNFVEQH